MGNNTVWNPGLVVTEDIFPLIFREVGGRGKDRDFDVGETQLLTS